MADKTADKRKQIMMTALQLFSSKGTSSTSMQEIAELCGISKGSLYLHFKSKEDLEKNIHLHTMQILEDQLVQIERESMLSDRERFRRQIEIMISHVLELREFIMMQMKDFVGKDSSPLGVEYLQESNLKLLRWIHSKLVTIYGEEIAPYVPELTLIMFGIFGSYFKILFCSQASLGTKRISTHLIYVLDELADSMLRGKPTPLISSEILDIWISRDEQTPQPRHPLLVIKQMKDHLKISSDMNPDDVQEAIESLSILETEILDLQPKKVILQGMLRNLEQFPELRSMFAELNDLIHLYINTRPDGLGTRLQA